MTLTSFVILLALFNHGNSQCIGTCYSGNLYPESQDIFQEKHLVGHSYKNITTDDLGICYRHCVQDCRCKACQMKGGRCELLDEDKTSKADNFVNGQGYEYFDLRQTIIHGQSHMVHQCYNGCCKTNPCLNGGSCIESCHGPSLYSGKFCQTSVAGPTTSCQDFLSLPNFPNDGVYQITRADTQNVISVYCYFNENYAWTLIESFKFDLKTTYQKKAFNQDFPRNENGHNWEDYRLSHDNMKYIQTKSTQFQPTCSFPDKVNSGNLNPDYLYGNLSDYDFINKVDSSYLLKSGDCARITYINIRGHPFYNVSVEIWSKADSLHTHVGCNHHSLKCDTNENSFAVPNAISYETCFGYYFMTANTASTCCSSPTSTTQWWLGASV